MRLVTHVTADGERTYCGKPVRGERPRRFGRWRVACAACFDVMVREDPLLGLHNLAVQTLRDVAEALNTGHDLYTAVRQGSPYALPPGEET